MLRHHTTMWAGLVALTCSLTTNAVARDDGAPPAPNRPDAGAAVIEKLHDTIVDAAYDAVDLEDVIEDLRATYELNIHVSWKRLEEAGVRKDDRIEITLTRVPLALLLEMILREADPDALSPLGYSVRGGIVIISTRDDLDRDTILKTYDITDLIESGYSIRRFANTPVLGLQLTGREFIGGERRQVARTAGGGQGGSGGGGIYGEPEDEPDRITAMERAQQVIDLIIDTVDPEDWDLNGGEIASLRLHDSILFVRHTIDGHRRVESLLDVVRSRAPAPLDGEAIIVRLRNDRAAEWRERLGDDFPRFDPGDLEALLAEEDGGEILFRAATTGHNGGRLWFSALTQRDVLSGMSAKLSNNAAAFDPVTGVATEGLELIVLPLLQPDGEHLGLDVQMAWIPPARIDEREIAITGPQTDGAPATIDRLERSMRTVSASATVERGRAIALTIPHQLDDRARVAEHEDWLIVRVRTVE